MNVTSRRKNLRRGAKNEKDLSGLERNDAEACSGTVSFMEKSWASLDPTFVVLERSHCGKERHLGILFSGRGEHAAVFNCDSRLTFMIPRSKDSD
jgi:hypothetical protein